MNVLVIDENLYRSRIFALFLIETYKGKIDIFRLKKKDGSLANEVFQGNDWINYPAKLPPVDLRFRHAGDLQDEYDAIPKSNLDVSFGGRSALKETRHRENEYPFFEPLQIRAGEVKSWNKKKVEELFRYAEGVSTVFPSSLLPPLYDEELEQFLEARHNHPFKIHPNDGAFDLDRVLPENGKVKMLILWNKVWINQSTQSDCRNALKQLICSKLLHVNPAKYPFFLGNNQVDLCINQKEFQSLEDIKSYDLIIVCAELGWNQFFTFFEGIYMCCDFRKAGFKGLLLTVSHAPWEVFRKKLDDYVFRILRTPYCWFYDLQSGDFCKSEILLEPRMSTLLLEDIQNYVIDPEGIIHEAFHDLKGEIGLAMADTNLDRQQIIKIVADFFDRQLSRLIMRSNTFLLINIKNDILKKLNDEPDLHPYYHVVQPYFDQVLSLSPHVASTKLGPNNREKWCVLHVEDDKNMQDLINNLLQKRKVNCISVNNGLEAIKKLKDDLEGKLSDGNKCFEANSIVTLLVDFRLEAISSEDGFWQPLQGYDLIRLIDQELANALSFAILTNKKGAIMRQVRKRNPLNIQWFSKEMLLSDISKDYLIDEIIDLSEDTYKANQALAENEIWNNGSGDRSPILKDWYEYYRKLSKKNQFEEKINALTEKYLKLFEAILKKNVPLAEALRKEIFEGEDQEIPLTFLGRFKEDPKTGFHKLPTFLTRLLGRRVVIALANLKKEEIQYLKSTENINRIDIIHNILRFGKLEVRDKSRDPKLFIHHLALPTASWTKPSGWLPEEEAFLNEHIWIQSHAASKENDKEIYPPVQ